MSKQVTKKQHYVPKFYLKNFENANGEIEVFNLKANRFDKPKTRGSICYGEFFYGEETGVEDDHSQKIENAFKLIEDNLSKNLDPLI